MKYIIGQEVFYKTLGTGKLRFGKILSAKENQGDVYYTIKSGQYEKIVEEKEIIKP